MDGDRASRGLYARIWRWHFFAAFVVIPFVLWQGLTGVVYLWHEEIADALWPSLRRVVDDGRQATLDAQVASALAALPGRTPRLIRVSDDPTRSTQLVFDAAGGLPQPAFVDPHSARYLGTIEPSVWLPGLTRKLHGGWPLGDPGSWLLELGAGWAIVMVLTGLYLWWPRSAQGAAGALYPRLTRGPRVFWRDLHAVAGVYFALVMLVFLCTAMPWTHFWGNQVLRPLQHATGQTMPAALGFGALPMHSQRGANGSEITLQQAVEVARAHGLHGELEVQPRAGDAPITVAMRRPRAANEITLQIDRYRGSVLARVTWADFPAVPRVIASGVDLHEGTFFGRANQWFNTALVAALLWLTVTGLIGWYRRRPGGGLAPPPRPPVRWPRTVVGVAAILCCVLPLLGLSVATIWAVDGAVRRLR